MTALLSNVWCYLMHPAPMRPVNGMYRCPACQRLYPVPWEKGVSRWSAPQRPATAPVAVHSGVVSTPARAGFSVVKLSRRPAA